MTDLVFYFSVFEIAHTKEKIETPQVDMNVENLLKSIQRFENQNTKWERNLKSVPNLKIYYEDFIQDKAAGLNQITEFLDLPKCPDLELQTTKLNPTDLKESIIK